MVLETLRSYVLLTTGEILHRYRYNSFQFRFRSKRGCQDAIALGYEHIAQERELGRFVRVVLRDVKAAFDKFWHTGVQISEVWTATTADSHTPILFFYRRTARIVHKTAK